MYQVGVLSARRVHVLAPRNLNPPIAGHTLMYEGLSSPVYDWDGKIRDHAGGCTCGAKPPGWPDLSGRQVKTWHREHKAEVRLWLERPSSISTHGGETLDETTDDPGGDDTT